MSKLGVVVGRFQTPYLHEGHLALLEYAKTQSDKVLAQVRTNLKYPLYERKRK